jgi:hypothetical protein
VFNLKQPAVGIISTALVCAVSLGFISLFDFAAFSGWVSYVLLCVIPMQIVIGVLWRVQHPRFATAHKQPLKGILSTLVAMVWGASVAGVYFVTVGGSVNPPVPMLIMFSIVSVPITFWICIVWGGWPANAIVKNPIAAGLLQLIGGYVLNYLLFRALFNYGFMEGAPVYVASLDPHGLFNAWKVLVFYISVLAAMFLVIDFDLWPFTKSPRLMKQPVLGTVFMLTIIAIGGLAFYIGTTVVGMDPVLFLVRVPAAYLFGSIVVLNMFQNSLFAKMTQPRKGILNAIATVCFGTALAWVFQLLMPTVTGQLASGPPPYDAEIWLASALLSVTFPFLVFYAEYFNFWPLTKSDEGAGRD